MPGAESHSIPAPHQWKPNLTVAAVIEQDGRYLLVEEESDDPPGGPTVFNQPAGHVDDGETILAAVAREVAEETTRHFVPDALVGIYQWQHPRKGITYLRFCFTGSAGPGNPDRGLDTGIVATHWLTRAEIEALSERLRSPLVLACIDDHAAGRRHPLDLLHHY